MGAYPALDIRPPAAPPDLLQQAARVMGIKNALAEQQLQPLQRESAQIDLAMKQRDLEDQKIWQQVISQPGNDDPTTLLQNLRSSGMSAKGYFAVSNMMLQHQKDLAALTKDQIANVAAGHEQARNTLKPILDLPDDRFQDQMQMWSDGVQKLSKAGYLKPDDNFPTQMPVDENGKLDRTKATAMLNILGNQQHIAEELKNKAEQWRDVDGMLINPNDPTQRAPLPGAMPLDKDLAKKAGIPEASTVGPDGKPMLFSPKFIKDVKDSVAAGEEFQNFDGNLYRVNKLTNEKTFYGKSTQMALLIHMDPFNNANATLGGKGVNGQPLPEGATSVNDLHGENFVKYSGMQPVQAAAVRAAGNYDLDVDKYPMYRAPQAKFELFALAKQYNPNFNEIMYDQVHKAALNANNSTPTSWGGQAQNFNMLTHHLGLLYNAIDALPKHDLPVLNKIANFYHTQKGDNPQVVFDGIKQAVDGEMAKLTKGTGAATDKEIENYAKTISDHGSDEQLRGPVAGFLGLMKGKLASIQYAYDNAVTDQGGKNYRPHQFVDPVAQRVFDAIGGDVEKKGTPNTNLTRTPGTEEPKKGAFDWKKVGGVPVKEND